MGVGSPNQNGNPGSNPGGSRPDAPPVAPEAPKPNVPDAPSAPAPEAPSAPSPEAPATPSTQQGTKPKPAQPKPPAPTTITPQQTAEVEDDLGFPAPRTVDVSYAPRGLGLAPGVTELAPGVRPADVVGRTNAAPVVGDAVGQSAPTVESLPDVAPPIGYEPDITDQAATEPAASPRPAEVARSTAPKTKGKVKPAAKPKPKAKKPATPKQRAKAIAAELSSKAQARFDALADYARSRGIEYTDADLDAEADETVEDISYAHRRAAGIPTDPMSGAAQRDIDRSMDEVQTGHQWVLDQLDDLELDEVMDEFRQTELGATIESLFEDGGGNDGGDGGDGGDRTNPHPEGNHERGLPRSEARIRIDESVAQIRKYQERGRFKLKGDSTMTYTRGNGTKETVPVSSPEVAEEITKTLDFFGIEHKRHQADRLFEAFQVYRGLSVDRDGKIFGKDGEELEISDEVFIAFLKEIRNNVRTHNHPFAYTNPHYTLGGKQRYPVVTTRRLAEFFTQNQTSENHLISNTEDFIKYSAQSWTKYVEPRMRKIAQFDQREVLLDMIDAAAPELGASAPGIKERTADSRVTLSEMLDADSEYAQVSNDENLIAENHQYLIERELRAVAARDKKRKRGQLDATKTPPKESQTVKVTVENGVEVSVRLNSEEVIEDPVGWWQNTKLNGEDAVRAATASVRTIQVFGLLPLAPTGAAEHGMGIASQSVGLRFLRGATGLAGEKGRPTKASLDRVSEDDMTDAILETIKLLAAQGREAVIDAGARGVTFDKENLHAYRQAGTWNKMGAVRKRLDQAVEMGMSAITGDFVGKKYTARVFLESLVFELQKSAAAEEAYQKKATETGSWGAARGSTDAEDARRRRRTLLALTPAQIEAALETDPHGFLREVMSMPEGMTALVYASNTSLSGVDPITEALRKTTSNAFADAAIGFTVGWFLRFGIRGAIHILPMSMTGIYLAKKIGINPARMAIGVAAEKAGLREVGSTAEAIADSNEFMLAGNDSFWNGLAQNTILDLARMTTRAPAYVLAFALIAAFGGIKPPDEDELKHLWYEWKIGGETIKTNWYWNELLGFAMPFAVAMHAGATPEGKGRAFDILWAGAIQQLQDNPWANVMELTDAIANWDKALIEAQARAEGYDQKIDKESFFKTQVTVWLMRRGYQTFEPALFRQFHNEHGLFRGKADLAHSSTMVYTSNPKDTEADDGTPPTVMTTWEDSQIRKLTMKSPMLAGFMNLVSGYYANNDDLQVTGYGRNQMPLVTNVDPTQQAFVDMMSVIQKDGKYKPSDKWTDDERKQIVDTTVKYLKLTHEVDGKQVELTASDLAALGIAIPYDARDATVRSLIEQKGALRDKFEERRNNGEWTVSTDGLSWEEGGKRINAARKKQQEAWDQLEAEQGELQRLIDKLFSDEIPYSAQVYNRWETNYRPLYTWKEGTEKAGAPATALDLLIPGNADKIERTMYASGDHKSSLMPWLTVDDRGQNTYDSQTGVQWQTEATDMEALKEFAQGVTIRNGINKGQNLWDVLSGGGAVGPGASPTGDWDTDRLLVGSRALIAAEMPHKELDRDDYKNLTKEVAKKTEPPSDDKGGRRTYRRGSYGRGSYTPSIYSHPAYGLNPDKPAGLYTKIPSYTRFDYLRPGVETKGSREAYRRKDF